MEGRSIDKITFNKNGTHTMRNMLLALAGLAVFTVSSSVFADDQVAPVIQDGVEAAAPAPAQPIVDAQPQAENVKPSFN